MKNVFHPRDNSRLYPVIDEALVERAVGAYLGLAVGDALGATTEFMTPNEIRFHYGVHRRMIGGGWLKLKAGQVTDDTTMSLALGDSILRSRGVQAQAVAQAFSDWMAARPVDIGNTVRRGIVHFRSTGQCSVNENDHDAGNGACMRCLPIALYYRNRPHNEIVEASRFQAHVTHHNKVSDAGTESVIQMLIAALHGRPKSDLQSIADQLVLEFPQFFYRQSRMENPGGWIVETLKAVCQAFFDNTDFETAMIDVVNRGGDADTTGAIVGMLAGALYGEDAIPKPWLKTLDKTVRARCELQALQLLEQKGRDQDVITVDPTES